MDRQFLESLTDRELIAMLREADHVNDHDLKQEVLDVMKRRKPKKETL